MFNKMWQSQSGGHYPNPKPQRLISPIVASLLSFFLLTSFLLFTLSTGLPRWTQGRSLAELIFNRQTNQNMYYPPVPITTGLFQMCVNGSCFDYNVDASDCKGARWCEQVQATRAFMIMASIFAGLAFIFYLLPAIFRSFKPIIHQVAIWLSLLAGLSGMIGFSLGLDVTRNSHPYINNEDVCVWLALTGWLIAVLVGIYGWVFLLGESRWCCICCRDKPEEEERPLNEDGSFYKSPL